MPLKTPKTWSRLKTGALLVSSFLLASLSIAPSRLELVSFGPQDAFAEKEVSTASARPKKSPATKKPSRAIPSKKTSSKKSSKVSKVKSSGKSKPALSSSARARLKATTSKSSATTSATAPTTYSRLDQQSSGPTYSVRSQIEALEVVSMRRDENSVSLLNIPRLDTLLLNRIAAITPKNEYIFFTLDPKLQALTERLIKESSSPHVAVVVMNPVTGKILALADKSPTIRNLALHADFPAASLFKVITAAAAVEQASISPYTNVAFRGGTYTLNQFNYLPNKSKDRRSMSVAEALGRSCNPVFGRIALRYLSPAVIRTYAEHFGFNEAIPFELPLALSQAYIPQDDYQLSRTAAGFGAVFLSPVHAAAFMSGIANKGILPKPYLVDRIVSAKGEILYKGQPESLRRLVKPETAAKLLQMMEYTTTIGTSKREFILKNRPVMGNIEVAAKTGTLSGDNPEGINNWFIAAAPMNNPEIAVAVVVVHPGGISSRASHIGRQILQAYFK